MPIEPHNVRFQVGRPIMPQEVKTNDQYREKLFRKYGRIPSQSELAKLEAKNTGCSTHDNTASDADTMTPVRRAGYERYRATMAAKTRATTAAILRNLTRPMTSAELSPIVMLSPQHIGALLRAAMQRGEVVRQTRSKNLGSLWSRADD